MLMWHLLALPYQLGRYAANDGERGNIFRDDSACANYGSSTDPHTSEDGCISPNPYFVLNGDIERFKPGAEDDATVLWHNMSAPQYLGTITNQDVIL